jgi:eukaryotic-like serine/threonine-protein kinase
VDTELALLRYRKGALLGSRYEVRSLLGQGGMAEVYLAWDRALRRRVAVKVLAQGLARDPRFVARFRREAHAAASLSHPSIVAVFDTGTEEGTPFIVMELVDGRCLDDLLWEEAPLVAERAARIADAVAGALGHAHRAGIVHRDVKPANIMLAQDGSVKVLDFGIARAVAWTPVTTTIEVRGTAEYLAPEQVQGRQVDGRSDIYSLGAVTYEMLTGRPPFTGDSPLAIAYRHVQEQPAPVRSLNPGVPAAVEAAVMRCLQKSPAARYQRAEEFRRDLRHALGQGDSGERLGPPVPPGMSPVTPVLAASVGQDEARSPSAPDPGVDADRSWWRRWWLAVGAVAVLCSVLGATVLLAASGHRSRGGPSQLVPLPTAPAPLPAPQAVRAAAECDGFLSARVTLTWAAAGSSVVDGYEVYRSSAPDGHFEMIALMVGRTSTRYVDAGLGTGETHRYVVKATGEGRTSPTSGGTSVDTPRFCFWP